MIATERRRWGWLPWVLGLAAGAGLAIVLDRIAGQQSWYAFLGSL